MDVEDALLLIDRLVQTGRGKPLTDLQRLIFRGSWDGRSYKEIHQDCADRCSREHLERNVGYQLWKLLTEVVGERVTKNNLHGPLERAQQRSTSLLFPLLEESGDRWVTPWDVSVSLPAADLEPKSLESLWVLPSNQQDWGDAPDVSLFVGREKEVELLTDWIVISGCRLVTLYGLPGIGKTALSVKLAERLRDEFECLIWRSLVPSPVTQLPSTVESLLADWLTVLSDSPHTDVNPADLWEYLRHHRCLLVLDHFDAVLQPGVEDGSYRLGYEGYGDLIQRMGQGYHHSCLVLTSRERPKETAALESATHPVRSCNLQGLRGLDGQEIFGVRGIDSGTDSDWRLLLGRYGGNPAALIHVATTILDLFGGDVTQFIQHIEEDTAIFGDIRPLLEQSLHRLSGLERSVLEFLVHHPESNTFQDIWAKVEGTLSRPQLMEALQALVRRSLLDSQSGQYWINPLIIEYFKLRSA